MGEPRKNWAADTATSLWEIVCSGLPSWPEASWARAAAKVYYYCDPLGLHGSTTTCDMLPKPEFCTDRPKRLEDNLLCQNFSFAWQFASSFRFLRHPQQRSNHENMKYEISVDEIWQIKTKMVDVSFLSKGPTWCCMGSIPVVAETMVGAPSMLMRQELHQTLEGEPNNSNPIVSIKGVFAQSAFPWASWTSWTGLGTFRMKEAWPWGFLWGVDLGGWSPTCGSSSQLSCWWMVLK